MEQQELKQKLSANYNLTAWKELLTILFNKIEYFTQPAILQETNLMKSGGQIGNIRLDDGRNLALFEVEVADTVSIAKNRKGLRDIAAKYIDQGIIHGALVLFYSEKQKDYRLTYIAKQTYFTDEGEIKTKETTPKRYTFLLGENETCTTAAIRFLELATKKKKGSVYLTDVTEAFSVERLNKEFFAGYKSQYKKFLDYRNHDSKDNRDYVKKLLGRLVFLQFLQKRGWMGVPANISNWSDGDKNYLSNLVEMHKNNEHLLSDILEPLFFNTLNEKRDKDIADLKLGANIKIPYLNGGLFDKDKLDMLDINFPYAYFKDLLMFFSMYNFTIDENDPDDSEVGIDPEMLGHIFESLLEDNKDKGAFYTPKEIVQYMSRESIIQYLKTHTVERLHQPIELLIKSGKVSDELQEKKIASDINSLLQKVKICDPAIGSGAFPMGILNVLFHCRQLLYGFMHDKQNFAPSEIKREIIQENIYGVDIEQGAVDIARLRFWLALIVDELEPQPLPNLDYKIICGNSLLSRFALDVPFEDILKNYNQEYKTNYTLENYKEWDKDYTNESDHINKNRFKQKISDIKNAFKTELGKKERYTIIQKKAQICDLEAPMLFGERTKSEKELLTKYKKELTLFLDTKQDLENNRLYENAFEWRFEFPSLLDDKGNFIGFDLVIGNPPYINIANIRPADYRELLKATYCVAKNKSDLYAFFVEKGLQLLKYKGVLSYIIPHTWKATDSFSKMREIIVKDNKLLQIVNLKMGVFEAIVQPLITLISKENSNEYYISVIDEHFVEKYKIPIAEILETQSLTIDTNSSQAQKNIYYLIEQNSVVLSSIIEFSRGIKTSNDKRFVLSKAIDDNCYKVYRGKNIKAYQLNWDDEYIWYRPDLMKEKVGCVPYTKDFFEVAEKLVTQRVNSSSQLLVAYDNQQNYFLDTVNVSKYKTWNQNVSLKYLCGILNSKLIQFWYCNKYTMPTIGIYEIHSIPIKVASNNVQESLSTIVDYIILAKKNGSPIISSIVSNYFIADYFGKIIDGCVYELYFPEHMKEKKIDILDDVIRRIHPINNLTTDVEKADVIWNVFNEIKKTDNPTRNRLELFAIYSPDILKLIIEN